MKTVSYMKDLFWVRIKQRSMQEVPSIKEMQANIWQPTQDIFSPIRNAICLGIIIDKEALK